MPQNMLEQMTTAYYPMIPNLPNPVKKQPVVVEIPYAGCGRGPDNQYRSGRSKKDTARMQEELLKGVSNVGK